jgi:hypothetical protein
MASVLFGVGGLQVVEAGLRENERLRSAQTD